MTRLPSRAALNGLAASPRTINDYAKVTPADVDGTGAATGSGLARSILNPVSSPIDPKLL